MGFKPGDSLGKQDSHGGGGGGFARASFAPASSSTSTNPEPFSTNTTNETRRALHKNEPIKFEIRTGKLYSFPLLTSLAFLLIVNPPLLL